MIGTLEKPALGLGPPVYDVDFGIQLLRWGSMLLAIPLGLVTAVLAAILLVNLMPYLPTNRYLTGLIIGAAIAPPILLVVGLAKRATREKVAAILGEHDGCESAERRAAILNTIRTHSAVVELGRLLVSQGRVGFVLRGVPASARTEVEPLQVPFQPVPLNERDPAFGELASHHAPFPATNDSRSWFDRKVLPAVATYTGLVFVAVITLTETVRLLQTGRPTVKFGMFLGFTAWLVWGLRASPNWQSSCQWALVPGGLIRRVPARKSSWRLHLFEPAKSILILTGYHGHWSYAYVADAAQSGSLQLRRSELDLLLAAWLSPLRPPRLEEIADLR